VGDINPASLMFAGMAVERDIPGRAPELALCPPPLKEETVDVVILV